jgi:hypothetical protein
MAHDEALQFLHLHADTLKEKVNELERVLNQAREHRRELLGILNLANVRGFDRVRDGLSATIERIETDIKLETNEQSRK